MKILIIALWRPYLVVEPLKYTDFDFRVITGNSKIPVVADFIRRLFNLMLSIVKYKPDMILCLGATYISLIALILAKLSLTPFILRLGGDFSEGYRRIISYYKAKNNYNSIVLATKIFRRWIKYKIAQFIVHHSTGIIVPSLNLKKVLLNRTVNKLTNIEVVKSPYNSTKLAVTNDKYVNKFKLEDKKIILTVTNLDIVEKYEGTKEAIPAIIDILQRRDNILYLIAGSGEFFNDLHIFIRNNYSDLLNAGRIILLGYVDDVKRLYEIADIVVYYSYRDGSGFPSAVSETLINKKPLIVNDAPWAREYIEATGTDLWVRNKDELICNIESLLDSDEYKELVDKRYKYVIENLNSEVIGKSLEEALYKLINRNMSLKTGENT